ncbi:hypothetical protein R1flu_014731 [Riccia fluitans]|uniref:Uncharacterized protein n=1 Tax=Riccia fluitans TaxID=41844 RepID=A0ABD1YHB4_9MARC
MIKQIIEVEEILRRVNANSRCNRTARHYASSLSVYLRAIHIDANSGLLGGTANCYFCPGRGGRVGRWSTINSRAHSSRASAPSKSDTAYESYVSSEGTGGPKVDCLRVEFRALAANLQPRIPQHSRAHTSTRMDTQRRSVARCDHATRKYLQVLDWFSVGSGPAESGPNEYASRPRRDIVAEADLRSYSTAWVWKSKTRGRSEWANSAAPSAELDGKYARRRGRLSTQLPRRGPIVIRRLGKGKLLIHSEIGGRSGGARLHRVNEASLPANCVDTLQSLGFYTTPVASESFVGGEAQFN